MCEDKKDWQLSVCIFRIGESIVSFMGLFLLIMGLV